MDVVRARTTLDRRADPLLALGFLTLGIYEVWIESGQVAGSRVGNTVFLLLATAPLARRRRHPLAVLAIVALAASVWSSALYLPEQPPLTPFLAVLVATFTAASRAAGCASECIFEARAELCCHVRPAVIDP